MLARMGAGGSAGAAEAAGPSLAEVLRPETLIPLARSPDMLERLAPHMPEEHRCEDAQLPQPGATSRPSTICSMSPSPCCPRNRR